MKKILTKIVFLMPLMLCFHASVYGQEYQYKGAYIYQFARIFDWSEVKDDFTVAVYGDSELKPVLMKIADTKKIANRSMAVKTVNALTDLANCQIVFVPSGKMKLLAQIQSYAAEKKLLVVTESKGAMTKGSGINFTSVNGKVLFEINKANLSKSGMKLPLSLERLAHKIY